MHIPAAAAAADGPDVICVNGEGGDDVVFILKGWVRSLPSTCVTMEVTNLAGLLACVLTLPLDKSSDFTSSLPSTHCHVRVTHQVLGDD